MIKVETFYVVLELLAYDSQKKKKKNNYSLRFLSVPQQS